MKIEGLEKGPRELAIGTSMVIGSYMLVLRRRHDHPRVQVLLQDGVQVVGEAWCDPTELARLVRIVTG